MKKHSLRTELILWSVGILLFCLISQVTATGIYAYNYASKQKEEEIHNLIEEMLEHYSDDPMDIFSLVDEAQLVNNLRVMVYSDEKLIYHSSSVGKLPDRSNLITAISTDSDGTTVMEIELPEFLDFPELDTVPLGVGSLLEELESNVVGVEEKFTYQGEPRTILVWSSNLAIEQTVNLFAAVNSRVALVVILITVLAVILFSRRLTLPIIKMEQVASNVADLDFTMEAVEQVRTRELSSLAQSINVMSDNLEEMINQLSSDNRSLSHKVENQEKLDQMRRQFVANISHEMKTPLSMLMMYSENLKLDLPNVDKEFYYDTIIQEATGLNAMVEQLLDTSAVENGLSQVDLVPLNFSEFVSQQVEKTLPLLQDHQFSQDIQEDIWIKGDAKYLEQALRNYLSNAISHTSVGKEISLRLWADDQVYLEVFNEGTPLPEEDMPYLWDSFYRGDISRTQRGEKRVGLGLYIVKTCISSHFGQVYAENHPHGVVFSFQLPLEDKI